MDKSWIDKPKTSLEYFAGVENFVKFASRNVQINGEIPCPCSRCGNKKSHSSDEVTAHLLQHGFLRGYKVWFFHGELCSQNENTLHPENENLQLGGRMELGEMLSALRSNVASAMQDEAPINASGDGGNFPSNIESDDVGQEEMSPIEKLMKEYDNPLYPDCKTFTVISFVLHIWNVKTIGGWSGKSLDLLFEILKIAFPEAKFPSTWYDAKKLIKNLGLGYEKIHACPNDCMLFWGENEKCDSCKTCGHSRWASSNKGTTENPSEEIDSSPAKKKPEKVLRYFPLILRLKRMYMCKESASSMRWHAEGRTNDGVLRHPADALAWKAFDERYPDFASDPRNVRLGLASDGFNPFGTMSTSHSTWPVILVPYNKEPKRNFSSANGDQYLFNSGGYIIGRAEAVVLDDILLAQAHRYVLLHSDNLESYRREFIAIQRRTNRSHSARVENQWFVEKFTFWLYQQVPKMVEKNCSEELIALATGPSSVVRRFNGFRINGYVFHTKDREKNRKRQNSGVLVEADGQAYYGRLSDIIELDYYGRFSIVLFRCDWVDVSRGIKKDASGAVMVNFSRLIHTGESLKDDPFVFSSQARQVFYVEDPVVKDWQQVIEMKPRDTFDMGTHDEENEEDVYDSSRRCMPYNFISDHDLYSQYSWSRADVEQI